MQISNSKDWIRFQQWRGKKVNAVSVLNPEVPVVNNQPTKQRTRVSNVELLMYRGTERSKMNEYATDGNLKKSSPVKSSNDIGIRTYIKDNKQNTSLG